MNPKSILIVSFVFPPYPGIGGRRWAKFARELSNRGFQVHVIAAENPFKEISPWLNDIKNHPEIIIKYLPLNYPKYLLSAPKNIFEKIMYRAGLFYLRLTTEGNYYDRAVKWKYQLVKETEDIIQKNAIKNIIVSGAPFHLMHHLICVKKKYPEINFITDFRDPWTNNPDFFGFSSLSQKRQQRERKMEKEVIENSDVIISVAGEMNDYLKSLSAGKKTKFITVENGFDPNDFEGIKIIPRKNEKIKFVFTGTLYLHVGYLFSSLVNSLVLLKKTNPGYFDLLQFDFYGDAPLEYIKIAKGNKLENLRFHGKIPLREVFAKISEANICMLFLQEHLSFSLSTKFCEYISQKKKIIVFSNPGKTSDFILKNKLGYAATPGNIEKVLLQIAEDFKNNKLAFDSDFDIEQFSVQRLTDKLVDCLK